MKSARRFLWGAVVAWSTGFAPAHGQEADVEPDPQRVVMRFGGDLLLAEHYERYAGDDVTRAFDGFTLFETADIAMVNLECPVTTRGEKVKKPFNFRMHPRFLHALTSAGIGVVNLANNHIYDYGRVGLFDTIRHLDSAGIRYVGAGRTRQEAHTPVLVNRHGKRIGLLGYYGGGEAPAAKARDAGVAFRDIALIREDIRRLRGQDSADCIVVNLHWGTEKERWPEPWQRTLGREIIDAGANAVVGHHPHVLQGIEQYNGGIIAYSLGNLVFGGNSRNTYDTAILELRFSDDGLAAEVIPVRVEEWRLMPLTGAEGDRVLQEVEFLSSIFAESIFQKKDSP